MATSKKAAARADQPTATYTVQSPLDHDNDRYAAGDTVDLTEEQAKPLLELRVIKPGPAAAA